VLAIAGLGSAGVAFVGAPMYAPNAAAAILCFALASATGALSTEWLAARASQRAFVGFMLLFAAGLACALSVPLLVFLAAFADPPIPDHATLAVPVAGVCLGWACGSGTLCALRAWRTNVRADA